MQIIYRTEDQKMRSLSPSLQASKKAFPTNPENLKKVDL